tara:strand:+ start:319 stop:906 length:588 start_codon:yes stop_codon:yes gene_type:complete
MSKHNLLILVSGGADSRVLVEWAVNLLNEEPYNPILLHFTWDYPSVIQEETSFRNTHPELLHISLELPMHFKQMPEDGAPGPRVVAARNQIMLSHAINFAAAHDIPTIWYGATAADQADYHDCRPEFIQDMNELSAPWGIKIEAPAITLMKRAVWEQLRYFEVEAHEVWSCYTPKSRRELYVQCGTCDSCVSNNV